MRHLSYLIGTLALCITVAGCDDNTASSKPDAKARPDSGPAYDATLRLDAAGAFDLISRSDLTSPSDLANPPDTAGADGKTTDTAQPLDATQAYDTGAAQDDAAPTPDSSSGSDAGSTADTGANLDDAAPASDSFSSSDADSTADTGANLDDAAPADAAPASDSSFNSDADSTADTGTDDAAPADAALSLDAAVDAGPMGPRVVETSPADGVTGVPITAAITARFNADMDPRTVRSAFTVTSASGAVSYDIGTRTATWTPLLPLSYATVYTATVATSAQTVDGQRLEVQAHWSFTTQDHPAALTVIATRPGNNMRFVSRTSPVEVVFSHDVDVTTLGGGSFDVGGLAGVVGYNPLTRTATFIPTSALPAEAVVQVTVQSVESVGGLTMLAPYQFSFRTAAAATVISGVTRAVQYNPAMAYNTDGDAIAIWLLEPGEVALWHQRVYWSRYDAASQQWSPEQPIDSETITDDWRPQVAAIGSKFVAIWPGHFTTRVGIYDGATWSTMDATWMSSRAQLKTSGTAALLARQMNDGVHYQVYDGGQWSERLVSDSDDMAVAASPSGFGIATLDSSSLSLLTWQGGAWVEEPLAGAVHSNRDGLQLAASGNGWALAYANGYDGNLEALVHDGTSWSAPEVIGQCGLVDLEASASGYAMACRSGLEVQTAVFYNGAWAGSTLGQTSSTQTSSITLASDQAGYAVLWVDHSGLKARRWSEGAWGDESTLDPMEPSAFGLRGSDDTQLAHWVSGGDLFVSLADSDGWSAAQGLESSSLDALTPTSATLPSGFAVSWSVGGGLHVARYQGTWGPSQDIAQGTHSGAAMRPRIALTPEGHALVVWEQWNDGQIGVFANAFESGAWGTAFEIAWPAREPEVTTDGSQFLIAYQRNTPERHAYARTWSTEALGAEVQLDVATGREPLIASDGLSFAAAWIDYSSSAAGAWSTDGNAWTAPTPFSGLTTRVLLSATPSSYVLYGSRESSVGRVHEGTGWGDEIAIGDGYLLESAASSDAHAVVMVETGTHPYQALWAIYRNKEWSTGRLMPAATRSGTIGSDGLGFRTILDGNPSYEGIWSDGAWNVRTVDLNNPWQIASDGGSWGVAARASDLWYLLDGRWENGGAFSPGEGTVNEMQLSAAAGIYATVLEQGAPGETVIRAGAGM